MDITIGRKFQTVALTLVVTAIGFGQNAANSRTTNLTPASLPYIDAHTHIYQLDPEGAVTLILSAMERLNGAKAFFQTEPYGPDNQVRSASRLIGSSVLPPPPSASLPADVVTADSATSGPA